LLKGKPTLRWRAGGEGVDQDRLGHPIQTKHEDDEGNLIPMV
jgi:hypothetical protein